MGLTRRRPACLVCRGRVSSSSLDDVIKESPFRVPAIMCRGPPPPSAGLELLASRGRSCVGVRLLGVLARASLRCLPPSREQEIFLLAVPHLPRPSPAHSPSSLCPPFPFLSCMWPGGRCCRGGGAALRARGRRGRSPRRGGTPRRAPLDAAATARDGVGDSRQGLLGPDDRRARQAGGRGGMGCGWGRGGGVGFDVESAPSRSRPQRAE